MIGGNENGKVFLNAFCSPAAIEQNLKAGDLVRTLLSKVGARGGGKPDAASGGGPDNGQLKEVLHNPIGHLD